MTLGFTPPAQASPGDAYHLQLLVFDGEGRKELHRQQRTVNVASAGSGEILPLVPVLSGRYNVRLSFEHAPSGITGSVFAPSVDVPDFAKAPLSLSGIALGRAEAGPVGGREDVAELLAFPPTAVRTFAPTDHVGAMIRVYQDAGARPVAVSVDTTVVNDRDVTVVTMPRTIDAAEFATGSVEHRFDLPLRQLRPGTFLLRVVATSGKHRVQRELSFTVPGS